MKHYRKELKPGQTAECHVCGRRFQIEGNTSDLMGGDPVGGSDYFLVYCCGADCWDEWQSKNFPRAMRPVFS